MDKDTWDILIKCAVAIAGIWAIVYKRTEILGLLHKDYTAKLDSTVRFFKDFYKNSDENKLTLDRAAQELVRSDYVDFAFVSYLIKLHEARIVSLDEIMRIYKSGRKSLVYTPKIEVNSQCFKLKIKEGRSVKRQTFYWGAQYVFFAFLFFFPLMFNEFFSETFMSHKAPILIYFMAAIYLVGTFMAAYISLIQTTNLRDAETFINKLKEADEKYKEYEQEQQKKLEAPKALANTVTNEREYVRRQ